MARALLTSPQAMLRLEGAAMLAGATARGTAIIGTDLYGETCLPENSGNRTL